MNKTETIRNLYTQSTMQIYDTQWYPWFSYTHERPVYNSMCMTLQWHLFITPGSDSFIQQNNQPSGFWPPNQNPMTLQWTTIILYCLYATVGHNYVAWQAVSETDRSTFVHMIRFITSICCWHPPPTYSRQPDSLRGSPCLTVWKQRMYLVLHVSEVCHPFGRLNRSEKASGVGKLSFLTSLLAF